MGFETVEEYMAKAGTVDYEAIPMGFETSSTLNTEPFVMIMKQSLWDLKHITSIKKIYL